MLGPPCDLSLFQFLLIMTNLSRPRDFHKNPSHTDQSRSKPNVFGIVQHILRDLPVFQAKPASNYFKTAVRAFAYSRLK